MEANDIAVKKPIEGELVNHGAAPYQHDNNNSDSYFVTLKNKGGSEFTIWGVELGEAIEKSGAIAGQNILIEHQGKKPVEVEKKEFSPEGEFLGTSKVISHRNHWAATVLNDNEKTTYAVMPGLGYDVLYDGGDAKEAAKAFMDADISKSPYVLATSSGASGFIGEDIIAEVSTIADKPEKTYSSRDEAFAEAMWEQKAISHESQKALGDFWAEREYSAYGQRVDQREAAVERHVEQWKGILAENQELLESASSRLSFFEKIKDGLGLETPEGKASPAMLERNEALRMIEKAENQIAINSSSGEPQPGSIRAMNDQLNKREFAEISDANNPSKVQWVKDQVAALASRESFKAVLESLGHDFKSGGSAIIPKDMENRQLNAEHFDKAFFYDVTNESGKVIAQFGRGETEAAIQAWRYPEKLHEAEKDKGMASGNEKDNFDYFIREGKNELKCESQRDAVQRFLERSAANPGAHIEIVKRVTSEVIAAKSADEPPLFKDAESRFLAESILSKNPELMEKLIKSFSSSKDLMKGLKNSETAKEMHGELKEAIDFYKLATGAALITHAAAAGRQAYNHMKESQQAREAAKDAAKEKAKGSDKGYSL